MAAGGARPGAGRPSKADERRVRDLSVDAIIKVYGSEAKGFQALLNSKEAALIKFVFEHAYGKPKEHHELSGPDGGPIEAAFEITLNLNK